MSSITVTFENGQTRSFPAGTTLQTISEIGTPSVETDGSAGNNTEQDSLVVAAVVNDRIVELSEPLMESAKVIFLTMANMEGSRIYQRSVTMLFLRAAGEILEKEAVVRVLFAIKNSLYCQVSASPSFLRRPSEVVGKIRERMWELVDNPQQIYQITQDLPEAIATAREQGLNGRAGLLSFRRFSIVHQYRFGSYQDYFYGYMMPDSRQLRQFDLCAGEEGIFLMLPSRSLPHKLEELPRMPKLMEVFKKSRRWNRLLQVDDIGALNTRIMKGKLKQLIYTAEALHDKDISNIAETIDERQSVRLVLIAGPSSSGKTTFAKRLCIHLRANGYVPHLISVDDYFVNKEDTPRDENGNYDFECIGAVDTELFQRNMMTLISGGTIDKPTYNFKTGKREYKGGKMKLEEGDILVAEGIHCLNDQLTTMIPEENKFKVYISALTQLSIDEHNRIPTTDGRLLRRMVRDYKYRGISAMETLQRWDSVRRGEDRNIFPFQENADVMFNSTLIYEMAVIKQYAEPLLFSVPHGTSEYVEARRLIKFLDYFQGISGEEVPQTSLLREFIGGSVFEDLEEE